MLFFLEESLRIIFIVLQRCLALGVILCLKKKGLKIVEVLVFTHFVYYMSPEQPAERVSNK
jgi:hypothetical protein